MEPLQRLLIERECERVLLQSMWNTDFGQAARTADLFVPDGVLVVGPRVLRGREAIREAFLVRQAMVERVSRHVATNLLITVEDEEHAVGSCYVTVYRHDGEPGMGIAPLDGPKSVGQQDANFVRTAEGWRFAEMRAAHIFLQEG